MSDRLRREVLWLIVLVLAIDGIFIGAYFVAQIHSASDSIKVGFTAIWTLVTLGVVIRGLSRVRRARMDA